MSLEVRESTRRAWAVNVLRSNVPPLPPGAGPARPPKRLEVFATGTTWLQLTWSSLGPGPVEARCGDRVATVDADGGPGAILLEDLAPDSAHRVELTGPGLPAPVAPRWPPGRCGRLPASSSTASPR
jgi:hypothetical protein